MSPAARKFALAARVTSSVGWFGALLVFFAHCLASLISGDPHVVRSVCIAMGLTAWFVILPLSLASLLTGLVQAVGTAWGLVRHYWVVAKLLLTAFATAILFLKLAPISDLSKAAEQVWFSATSLPDLKMSLLVHSIGGLLVLLMISVLAFYKPAGVTPFAARSAVKVEGDAASGHEVSCSFDQAEHLCRRVQRHRMLCEAWPRRDECRHLDGELTLASGRPGKKRDHQILECDDPDTKLNQLGVGQRWHVGRVTRAACLFPAMGSRSALVFPSRQRPVPLHRTVGITVVACHVCFLPQGV